MKTSFYRSVSILGLLNLVASYNIAVAQDLKPKQLDETSVNNQIRTIKEADLIKSGEPYIVSGVTKFNGWFIVTDKVIFKSGSQLVFTKQALDNRRAFFIVTKELVSEDNNSPGSITFEK